MEIKRFTDRLTKLCVKYKYAILVLFIGLALLLIPEKQSASKREDPTPTSFTSQEALTQESLAQVLEAIAGAGKVKVLLSTVAGEETIYQTDTDDGQKSNNTVIITDAERNEAGLIQQINPATYKGAIVVCQGADSPAVRLAVIQAVSKITGLGTDAICVLKMQ